MKLKQKESQLKISKGPIYSWKFMAYKIYVTNVPFQWY